MQTTVGELERQLASARAQVKTAEKDREEVCIFFIIVSYTMHYIHIIC